MHLADINCILVPIFAYTGGTRSAKLSIITKIFGLTLAIFSIEMDHFYCLEVISLFLHRNKDTEFHFELIKLKLLDYTFKRFDCFYLNFFWVKYT